MSDSFETDEEQDQRFASLGRLAATMAHEFNNVLMGIQPFVEVLSRRGLDAVDVERALKHITLSIERGKQITAEVLRVAHPIAPTMRSIDVGEWLKSLEMDLCAVLRKDVQLRIEIDDGGEALYGAIDVNQMNQVLLNLVNNAKDAMPNGGTLTITAARCHSWHSFAFATTLTTPDRFVRITVSDTGCGMDTATVEKIFEPLFTTKARGTGLGLAVVKQIVQRHGGFVSVESAIGSGTQFHLFVPAALAPEYEDEALSPERNVRVRTDLRLLIVEDDRNVSTAIASALRHLGLHVDLIHTGGRAVEAVRQFGSEAVILDVGLPDISGPEVFWNIRKEFPQLPVVFSTAHADEASLASPLAEARVAFLAKPYTTDALLAALAQVIDLQ
jgi:CheY-like chemotaxis protein